MFLRAPVLALMAACVFFVACKPRLPGGGGAKEAGDFYDASYRGPNMSDPACAADGSKCNCVLNNEYDKFKDAAEGTPEKKEWYRQCIGQEIWTYATGTSSRFHTYYTTQKTNAPGDYGLTFHTEDRPYRFKNWGLINDPSCCIPRSAPGANDGTCPESVTVTREDTYGWDYCPGDDVLLSYVGAKDKDYTRVDPACGIGKLEDRIGAGIRTGPSLAPDGGKDTAAKRSDACFLEFGTSSGAVGWRKFPNPRFNKEKWKKLNDGSASSWVNFSHRVPGAKGVPDYGKDKSPKMRLADGSVEPPFHLGQTCGSCHVGFKPTHPPVDPANPTWNNIDYAIGNIFTHNTEIHAAGTPIESLEHQFVMYARPGTVDTSALTNDSISNPGTFNAIINLDRRPGLMDPKVKGAFGSHAYPFTELVSTYRRDANGKFKYGSEMQPVAHILKGGEDSVDVGGGILRVYANIFSCTETCLANHLDDLRAFSGRGSRQTPFELEQCRRDCPGYTALEDRVYDVIDFLLRVRPNDLKDAKDPPEIPGGINGEKEIADIMAKKDGTWYAAGKQVFANKCAKCHSSLAGQDAKAGAVVDGNVTDIDVNKFVANADKRDENGVRQEWFGSDVLVPQKVIGTLRCRSLHTNHNEGHLWEAYASDTFRQRDRYNVAGDDVFTYPEEGLNKNNLGGRGFYRNISLLNVWAHAPFMHNNAVGPDWKSPFWAIDRGSGGKWDSIEPNPSVKTRLEMYQKSMEQLFLPAEQREKNGTPYKVTLTANPVVIAEIPIIPEFDPDKPSIWKLGSFTKSLIPEFRPIKIGLPAGIPVTILSSIRLKQLIANMMEAIKSEPTPIRKAKAAQAFIDGVFGSLLKPDPRKIATNLASKGLTNCADIKENGGHEFSDLTREQKDQIIDFMKTL